MKTEFSKLNTLFEKAGISVPSGALKIGQDLSYAENLKRTVVVQFSDTDFPEIVGKTLVAICSTESVWFWVNRFGEETATKYPESSLSDLMNRLIELWPNLHNIGDDIYLVSGDGKALLSFDHHISEDGMPIFFNDIERAGLVIS